MGLRTSGRATVSPGQCAGPTVASDCPRTGYSQPLAHTNSRTISNTSGTQDPPANTRSNLPASGKSHRREYPIELGKPIVDEPIPVRVKTGKRTAAYNVVAFEGTTESGRPVYSEPTSYREAVEGSDSTCWRQAMDDEFCSVLESKTWQTVSHVPQGKTAISCR